MNTKQNGFAHLVLILVALVVIVIGGVGYYVFSRNEDTKIDSNNAEEVATSSETKIKHLGVNLDYYDPATNKAGDFVFTKENMSFNMLFMNYGYVIPASSAGPAKSQPQPTFILPLGTKVHALVDGEVFEVPKLYSDDYSVSVKGEGSDLLFETEHVINVLVKKGDKVKAGDVIAEVSDYDAHNWAGMGLVEIGVLKGGNPPQHLCPFDYLDDSIKEDTLAKITAFQKSWEEYRGDDTVYDESALVMPGCVTRDPIEG